MTVVLHVCVTCRAGQPVGEGELVPGARLYRALLAQAELPGVTIKPVECLSACTQGCSIALTGNDRWTYIYGRLSESDAEAIRTGVAAYALAPAGLVPWRERPDIFRKQSIARVPPLQLLPEA